MRRLGWLGLIVAFLVQAGLLGWMLFDRAMILKSCREIRLAVKPVDPRDLLRGDYVVLAYAMSDLQTNQIAGDDDFAAGAPIYVSLAEEGDTWKATAMHRAPPADGVFVKGTVTRVTALGDNCGGAPCAIYRVAYNLEQFFVPEGKGRELERLRNDQKLSVDVAVATDGRAALKRLVVDGVPQFEEPLY